MSIKRVIVNALIAALSVGFGSAAARSLEKFTEIRQVAGGGDVYSCPVDGFRPHYNQAHKRRGGTHGSTRARRARAGVR